jgi:ribosomal protein S18 acetylase RimI-like enzyme
MNALEIARIYAVREKIGSGVGKAMLEFSIALAEKMKKQIIWLGVWEHNIRAINFYERFGFKKVGEHVFMLGEDAQTDWLMQKELKY